MKQRRISAMVAALVIVVVVVAVTWVRLPWITPAISEVVAALPGGEQMAPLAPLAESVATALATSSGGRRVIALDPGHGGPEAGASANGVVEKSVNLTIAQELARLLEADGFRVVMTRYDDGPVYQGFRDAASSSQARQDLQTRVDIANGAEADLFVSIHNNGSENSLDRGSEVWYSEERSFGDRNELLAQLTLEAMLDQLAAAGAPVFDRGIKPDTEFRVVNGRNFNIYILGPGDSGRPHEPTTMPGILGESLFISNPSDAAALRRPAVQRATAQAFRTAINRYFQSYPTS